MSRKSILILNPSPRESERLSSFIRHLRPVVAAAAPAEIPSIAAAAEIDAALVDAGFAGAPGLEKALGRDVPVIVTGSDEAAVERAAAAWPSVYYVDTFVARPGDAGGLELVRAVERALEDGRFRSEAEALRRSLALQEAKTRDIFAEVQEIKGLINLNLFREVERRVAIEAKYVSYQKERERLEVLLRKIYAAEDVRSLLDLVPDIRDIVQASSMTVYMIEENDVIGRYLRPLVWESAFLNHSDFTRFIAPLDAQDFAAAAARYGRAVNVVDPAADPRMAKRYTDHLKHPPRSLLAVPIMHDRTVIGVVEVYDKTSEAKKGNGGFTRDDQQILQSLSEHMAIAMIKLNLIQYDALTGLLRPDPFFEKVLQKVNVSGHRRQEEGIPALVMGDVDWFKNYNDRNGQEAGNKVLRELAQVLKMSIREEDLLCRYGGEEFLIFFPGVKGLEAASHLTERIRKNVADHYFEFQEFQPGHNLTMSFGITIFPGRPGERAVPMTRADLKQLAGEADLALAEAKGKRRPEFRTLEGPEPAEGKNRVAVYEREEILQRVRPEAEKPRERPSRERRKHERHAVSTVLVFHEESGYRVAKTVNISLGGARIITDTKLCAAKTMDVILVLGETASSLRGDVIYSEKAETEPPIFYSGLRFHDLKYRDVKELEAYLAQFPGKGPAEG